MGIRGEQGGSGRKGGHTSDKRKWETIQESHGERACSGVCVRVCVHLHSPHGLVVTWRFAWGVWAARWPPT